MLSSAFKNDPHHVALLKAITYILAWKESVSKMGFSVSSLHNLNVNASTPVPTLGFRPEITFTQFTSARGQQRCRVK